ncbi:hypothetical protein AP222_26135, partial [Escherichia coli]
TAGAAVVNKGDKTRLINGETKTGLGNGGVFEIDFTGNNLKRKRLAPVLSPDGVPGGFSGGSQSSLFFFGGGGVKGGVGGPFSVAGSFPAVGHPPQGNVTMLGIFGKKGHKRAKGI